MKLKYKSDKIVALLFIASIVAATGCKKLLDINHDPNNPSLETGTAKIVFPTGVMAVAGVEGGDFALVGGMWGEYVTQQALASQYQNIARYDLKSTDENDGYTRLYSFGLKNLQFVIDKANASQDWNFYLMGTVMKAYATSLLVDIYDKIPYSEALKGSENITPKFDNGDSIYNSLIASLDTALSKDFSATSAIDLRATGDGKVDLLFGGDIEKWKEFANTLELKLYLRMVNANPSAAQKGIESLYARNATFLSEDAEVTGFTDVPSHSNPLYEQNIRQLNIGTNLVASRTFLAYLQSNNDPRAVDFFGANAVGLNQGDYLNNSSAALSASVLKETPEDPVVFLSAAESYFLQAEARERYFSGNGAKELYNSGVIASFTDLGEDGSGFVAPGGKYEYPSGTMDENIEAIIVQKWVSCAYGIHFIEGWFEKNRTGFPKTSPVYSDNPSYVPGEFVVAKNSVLPPGQLPKRLVFPDQERATNPNTPAEVPITTPVWWGL